MIVEEVLAGITVLKAAKPDAALCLLGLGVFSISISILKLMKTNWILALPVTFFSVFVGYVASTRLEADFFLVLFGITIATSTAAGWLSGAKEEQPN